MHANSRVNFFLSILVYLVSVWYILKQLFPSVSVKVVYNYLCFMAWKISMTIHLPFGELLSKMLHLFKDQQHFMKNYLWRPPEKQKSCLRHRGEQLKLLWCSLNFSSTSIPQYTMQLLQLMVTVSLFSMFLLTDTLVSGQL